MISSRPFDRVRPLRSSVVTAFVATTDRSDFFGDRTSLVVWPLAPAGAPRGASPNIHLLRPRPARSFRGPRPRRGDNWINRQLPCPPAALPRRSGSPQETPVSFQLRRVPTIATPPLRRARAPSSRPAIAPQQTRSAHFAPPLPAASRISANRIDGSAIQPANVAYLIPSRRANAAIVTACPIGRRPSRAV